MIQTQQYVTQRIDNNVVNAVYVQVTGEKHAYSPMWKRFSLLLEHMDMIQTFLLIYIRPEVTSRFM